MNNVKSTHNIYDLDADDFDGAHNHSSWLCDVWNLIVSWLYLLGMYQFRPNCNYHEYALYYKHVIWWIKQLTWVDCNQHLLYFWFHKFVTVNHWFLFCISPLPTTWGLQLKQNRIPFWGKLICVSEDKSSCNGVYY